MSLVHSPVPSSVISIHTFHGACSPDRLRADRLQTFGLQAPVQDLRSGYEIRHTNPACKAEQAIFGRACRPQNA